MDSEPSHWQDAGEIPTQGGPTTDVEANSETNQWDLIVSSLGEAMGNSGLEELDVYIAWHKESVDQYIFMRKILDLCMETERSPGVWVS